MYEISVPYHNGKDAPKTKVVQLALSEREIFKLSPEFNLIFNWRDELRGDPRDLDPQEVIPYFTAFEEVLLTAYGVLSADAEEFAKGDRYRFEESYCFNALLMMFVKDPGMVVKFLEETVPKDLEETLKTQAENLKKLDESTPELAGAGQSNASLQEEIDRLRAQMGNQPGSQPTPPAEN